MRPRSSAAHNQNGDAEAEMWLMETVIGSRAQIGHRGNMSSTTVYEYESARGFWNVLDVFDRYALPATLFVCGRSAELFPTFVQEAEKRKWEIVSENYRFIDYFGIDPAVEAEHTVKALECIKVASLSGTIPKSFHCPRPSHLTEGFALEAFKKSGAEMLYSNDGYGDDLPYYAPKTGLLYVPMSLDCNDQSESVGGARAGMGSRLTRRVRVGPWILIRCGLLRPRLLCI